ncbi:hypothetical protein [Mycolicibacterium sp.]|uniref:hypothetical protein n=1 Tax=Mycolicibacterium sp. TaxID=2320850 RepID=UPI003D0995F7
MGFDKKWYGDRQHARGAEDTGATEFSFGPGPVPRGKELAPPSEGGQYVGRSPDMVDPPRGRYRRSGAPRGYAGEQIAR